MRHDFDPRRGVYRTKYPPAKPLDYVLMFILAFVFGAMGAMALAIRVHGESRPSRGGDYVPATPENIRMAYESIALCGLAGGIIAMAVFAFLIRQSIRELRDREVRLREEWERDVHRRANRNLNSGE